MKKWLGRAQCSKEIEKARISEVNGKLQNLTWLMQGSTSQKGALRSLLKYHLLAVSPAAQSGLFLLSWYNLRLLSFVPRHAHNSPASAPVDLPSYYTTFLPLL